VARFELRLASGLGRGRGRFRVDTVTSSPLAGPATPIYDGSRQLLATRVASFSVDGMLPAPDGDSSTIILRFLTPTRLVHNAQSGAPTEFHVLVRNVLRRVNLLNHCHCGDGLHRVETPGGRGARARADGRHLDGGQSPE